jgi:hypothetical protein
MKILHSKPIYCTSHNAKCFYKKLNPRFPVRLTHFVIAMLAVLSSRMINVSSAKEYRREWGRGTGYTEIYRAFLLFTCEL